jgi:hypothetical protein
VIHDITLEPQNKLAHKERTFAVLACQAGKWQCHQMITHCAGPIILYNQTGWIVISRPKKDQQTPGLRSARAFGASDWYVGSHMTDEYMNAAPFISAEIMRLRIY